MERFYHDGGESNIKKEDVKVPEKENLKKHWASKAIQKRR